MHPLLSPASPGAPPSTGDTETDDTDESDVAEKAPELMERGVELQEGDEVIDDDVDDMTLEP